MRIVVQAVNLIVWTLSAIPTTQINALNDILNFY